MRRILSSNAFRAVAKTSYCRSSIQLEVRAFSQSNKDDDDLVIPGEKERSFGRDRQEVDAKEDGKL